MQPIFFRFLPTFPVSLQHGWTSTRWVTWAHLIVHGVLHLCGMDHQNDEEAELMEQLEIRILEGLNIANPYYDRSNIPA